MKFTWLGGPSFVLELGPFRLVGDPVLADRVEVPGLGVVTRVKPAPSPDALGVVADVSLVTSLRPDHFDPVALEKRTAGTVLAPAAAKLPTARVLSWGESIVLEKAGTTLSITAVPAGVAAAPPPAERDNGYFLRLEGGAQPVTAYVTGDTRFSEATRELQLAYGYSNLLVLYIGAERAPDGSMRSLDSKDAMQIVYRMQPNAIAAVHHSTFSHYQESIDPLIEKIELTIYDKRLRRLREGESFEKG
ncbi:MAG TPA: MBL fold metallo-hydrolase [Candidatus Krumholzibacteria bacterium]|nr:MBL fold metallo-hydrolase [Candidatus Krumholzibacteria bacterium]